MSKIKLRILGTTAGVPTKERAHAAIYLSYDDGEEFCYLWDCGEGTQRQFLFGGLNVMKINQMFITHWHGDHCLGLPGMVDTMGFEGRQKPLTVYAPEAGKVRRSLAVSHSMGKFKIIPRGVPSRGSKVTTLLEAERFRIVSTPVKHSVPAVAYALLEKDKLSVDPEKAVKLGLPQQGELYSRLKEKGEVRLEGRKIRLEDISVTKKGKKVVYSGDTEICDNLKKLVSGADLLVQDCTYFSEEKDFERPHEHASLPEVIEMVREEKVKKAVLTHISRKCRDIDQMRKMVEGYDNIEIAEDFLEVTI
ncbi:MAG: MBL fold metallo-hydrolase [Candidatus Omnitrophota bacterium]